MHYLCLKVESQVHRQLSPYFWDRFQQSFGPLDWCGTEEFSVEEDQVDQWIGDDAFCPTDCSPELLAHIENQVSAQDCYRKTYYYSLPDGCSLQEEMNTLQARLHYDFQEELNQHFFSFKIEQVEDRDWNEDWKKFYQPQFILNRWSILPSWHKNQEILENTIYIHPAMAFGTGTHETTQLCLELFLLYYDRYFRRNSNGSLQKRLCLDYGCGSGILGLMSLNHTNDWDHVYFYDIDPLSLQNTQHNIDLQHNNYSESSYSVKSELTDIPDCQLIWANLIAPVLYDERPQFLRHLEDRGIMIISGLLKDQEDSFFSTFLQDDFYVIDKRIKNDWMALIVQKQYSLKS